MSDNSNVIVNRMLAKQAPARKGRNGRGTYEGEKLYNLYDLNRVDYDGNIVCIAKGIPEKVISLEWEQYLKSDRWKRRKDNIKEGAKYERTRGGNFNDNG